MTNTLMRMKYETTSAGYVYSLFLSAGAVKSNIGSIPEGTQAIRVEVRTQYENGAGMIHGERISFASTTGVSLGEWNSSYNPPVRPHIIGRGPTSADMTLEGTLERVVLDELTVALWYSSMQDI